MPSIQIKHVPVEVHETLRLRAATAGQSLQEYLLARLTEDASTPTVDELLDRVRYHTGGRVSLDNAVQVLREERDLR